MERVGNEHIKDTAEFQTKAGELFGTCLLESADLSYLGEYQEVQLQKKTGNTKKMGS